MNNNQDNENLMWKWAYLEQLHLYYTQDAFWIKCAREKWTQGKGDAEYYEFLKSYGLLRGKVGSYLKREEKKNRQKFLKICKTEFAKDLNIEDFKTAGIRWNKVLSKIKNECRIESIPYSATLKTYWFFQPEKVPMFDSQVSDAIKTILNVKKYKKEKFLDYFLEFYNKKKQKIIEVDKEYSYKYKFYPRIADKYLWLYGSGKSEEILEKFREGVKKIPIGT